MTDDSKHGWIVESCHLCGAPAVAGSTCPHCGAVNFSPNPDQKPEPPRETTPPAASVDDERLGRPTHCWSCKYPLPVFTYVCSCGADNTPIWSSKGDAAMSQSWSDYSLNGCLFEQRPSAAPELSTPSMRLPQQIDLRMHCPPVENQLRTNSCVANAVVGALEYHQKKAGLPFTDMSRLFVYYNARALSDTEAQDGGSFIHHGMAAVLAHGACEATLWPFQEGPAVTTKPPEAAYKNAMRHEAVQYARTPRGEPALTVLAQGLPVVFGMFAPMDYYQGAAQTGTMPKPNQVTPTQPPSGHAMLIVGYDLSDRTYLVRNSWGAEWADQGYCRIPFETMDAWARPEDFWTIGAIEQAAGFKLTGPSMIDAMRNLGVDDSVLEIGGNSLDRLRSDLRSRLSTDLETAKRDFRDRLRGK